MHQSLQHPNIVRYQECFEDKSNVYIVLELCENKVPHPPRHWPMLTVESVRHVTNTKTSDGTGSSILHVTNSGSDEIYA